MDPVIAVWVGLALNAAGVLMMIGAKRQQISDLLKRMDAAEDDVTELSRDKLSVSDYRREHSDMAERITELDHRVDRRCNRIELRLDGQHGGTR